jgi:hypothetical protein
MASNTLLDSSTAFGSMSQLEDVAFDEMALARRKAWLALDLLRGNPNVLNAVDLVF